MAEEDKARNNVFSRDNTGELAEMTDPKVAVIERKPRGSTVRVRQLLKRYVHMDPKAMQMARKRFKSES